MTPQGRLRQIPTPTNNINVALAVLIVAILLGAAGQIALKAGINSLGTKPSPGVVLRSIFSHS